MDRVGNAVQLHLKSNIIQIVTEYIEWIFNYFNLSDREYLESDESFNYTIKVI